MHTDIRKFCTYVLWLSGYSTQAIASWIGVSEGQVRGIIGRSPWRSRKLLSTSERQSLLNDYRAVRMNDDGTTLDGGLLDGHDWQTRERMAAKPLELGGQRLLTA